MTKFWPQFYQQQSFMLQKVNNGDPTLMHSRVTVIAGGILDINHQLQSILVKYVCKIMSLMLITF